jgi:predicted Zn-dependent protease
VLDASTADGYPSEPWRQARSCVRSPVSVNVVLTGAVLVLAFDTIGAAASRFIGLPYGILWTGSFIIYLAVTYRAALRAGLLAGMAAGALLGLVDSTLGWLIAWALGPGRSAEPMSTAAVAAAIMLVVALGAAWGLLGAIAARSLFGRVATAALVAIAVFVETLNVARASVIYFVPIGQFRSVPLADLERYCRERFSVRVVILPLLTPERSTYDPLRDQLIAQGLVAQMKRSYSKEASDPRAILIGLTDGDMYIRSKDWQFAFGYREDQLAIVSAARMNPARFGMARNDGLLQTRVRKMTVRTIAFLHQRFAPSDNPDSVLYRNLLGLEELDAMGEDF